MHIGKIVKIALEGKWVTMCQCVLFLFIVSFIQKSHLLIERDLRVNWHFAFLSSTWDSLIKWHSAFFSSAQASF